MINTLKQRRDERYSISGTPVACQSASKLAGLPDAMLLFTKKPYEGQPGVQTINPLALIYLKRRARSLTGAGTDVRALKTTRSVGNALWSDSVEKLQVERVRRFAKVSGRWKS